MEDMLPIHQFDKEFIDILTVNGFVEDCDKDERTTYIKNNLCVTLYWDGDITEMDSSGMSFCISMDISKIFSYGQGESLYVGKRPSDKEEVIEIFKGINYIEYLDIQ